ncbi:hypothetical protein ABN199_26480, partial [Klebsiella pneumoniae]
LKMPAFEWVHVQLHQQKGMISLSPPTICNSARKRHLPFRPFLENFVSMRSGYSPASSNPALIQLLILLRKLQES